MKAVKVDQPGGPEQLRIVEVDTPEPGLQEVLVKVHATALNRADLLQRQGRYDPPEGVTDILGLEAAGTVERVGPGAHKWRVGDRVFGLLSGGGYAEFVAFHQDLLMAIPASLSFGQAAAIPEAFLTAYQALVLIGGLKAGETVLIHAGASGVGSAAIQMAKSLGATPVVTVSHAKRDICLSLGAALAIDYKKRQFDDEVIEFTGGTGAQMIVDFIGAPYLEPNIRAASTDGRIVLLGLMGGTRVDSLHLGQLFRKRLSLTASTLRNRPLDYKVGLVRRFDKAFLPRIADGEMMPLIDSEVPLEQVPEAHRRMESNLNAGKIVVTIPAERT